MEHEQPEFDEVFYLRLYPDIAAAGVDPYQHFLDFGIHEGRLGARPTLRRLEGGVAFDATRETILVVSHEASVTGAPILSLNLVRCLQSKYNVVSLLLGGGPLVAEFRQACVLSVEPRARRHHAELAHETIVQLAALHQIKFAIVNSVECALVLEPLAQSNIPTVALVHEFATYTRPGLLFQAAFKWASELVFSTRITYEDAISHWPELAARQCRFFRQGRCVLLTSEHVPTEQPQELERVRSALRPAELTAGTLVVIGIGSIQMRKGVELFVDCAARLMKTEVADRLRFVWIGDGLDAENDTDYSVFLLDQIHRSGLDPVFEFMATTPLVEEVYRLADVLLLTSRLDPLPGVAIEAMSHCVPVVCFDRTTGIADVLSGRGMADACVVPYLDTAAMANRVREFVKSPALRSQVGSALERIAAEDFDMDTYVDRLERLALAVAVASGSP